MHPHPEIDLSPLGKASTWDKNAHVHMGINVTISRLEGVVPSVWHFLFEQVCRLAGRLFLQEGFVRDCSLSNIGADLSYRPRGSPSMVSH
jgi:hypothetical protein